MSNPEGDIQRSARRHPAAIWGIIAALALAALALLIFAPWRAPDETPVAASPSETSAVQIPQQAVTPAAPSN